MRGHGILCVTGQPPRAILEKESFGPTPYLWGVFCGVCVCVCVCADSLFAVRTRTSRGSVLSLGYILVDGHIVFRLRFDVHV